MRLSNKRVGFTLAEVLITLGIIGVVAAMTMPTLMNSTQGAQYKTAYKKALSAISQAVTLNVALDEWNFADVTGNSGNYQILDMLKTRTNVVRNETGNTNLKDPKGNTYKIGYSSVGKLQGITAETDIGTNNVTVFFNDGIMFSYDATQTGCTEAEGATAKVCTGIIDVNGIKAPNRIVQCNNSDASENKCDVKNPTDIYPVRFYDSTIVPNSTPARAVLYSK